MNIRTRKLFIGCSALLALYFAAYFASVRTDVFTYKGVSVPIPHYRPYNGNFVRAMFVPAHLIDAAHVRRAHWEPRTRS